MGATVTILIATDGSKGGDFDPQELAHLRSKEAIAAATVLDANLIQMNFPDGELSQSERFASGLTTEILHLKPDLLVAHAPNDYHADHRAVSAGALIAASFRAPVLWVDPMMGNDFLPNYYVALPSKNGLVVKRFGGAFPQIHFHTVVVSSNHCSNAYAPGHSESQYIQTPLFVIPAHPETNGLRSLWP